MLRDRSTVGDRLQAEMARLWKEFHGEFDSRMSTVEKAVVALLSRGLPEDLRREACEEAHRLAGSLGTFGLAEASRLAREIERSLETPVRSDRAGLGLARRAVALRALIEAGPDREPLER